MDFSLTWDTEEGKPTIIKPFEGVDSDSKSFFASYIIYCLLAQDYTQDKISSLF